MVTYTANEINFLYCVHSVQGCTDITGVAKGNHNVTPYILVTGDVVEAKQTFLIIDKTLVTEVPLNCSLPFVLMAALFLLIYVTPRDVEICIPLWKLLLLVILQTRLLPL